MKLRGGHPELEMAHGSLLASAEAEQGVRSATGQDRIRVGQPSDSGSAAMKSMAILSLIYLSLVALGNSLLPENGHIFSDSSAYILAAKAIRYGGPGAFDLRMPGYGLFLSFFVRQDSSLVMPAVVLAQALLTIGTALMAQRLFRTVYGTGSVMTFGLCLFSLSACTYPLMILSETLFSFFLLLHCALSAYHLLKPRRGLLLASAAAGALCVLVKPHALMVFPVSLAIMGIVAVPQNGWRAALAVVLLGAFAFAISVGAIAAYKYSVTGEPGLISAKYSDLAKTEVLAAMESKLVGFPQPHLDRLRERAGEKTRNALGISSWEWTTKTARERQRITADNFLSVLASYDAASMGRAFLMSLYIFMSEDPGGVLNLFGQRDYTLSQGLDAAQRLDLHEIMENAVPLTTKIGGYAYAFIRALLLLVAVKAVFSGPCRAVGLLLLGQVILAFAVCNVMSSPRYRYPVDPLIALLIVAYAIQHLSNMARGMYAAYRR